MAAQYREVRKYAHSRATDLDLPAAAKSCGFRVVENTLCYANLRCGLNFWSFGENIEVLLATEDDAVIVDIRSACALPLQIEDWGKNRRNTRRLFDALDATRGETEGSIVPTCAKCGYLAVGFDSRVCPECGAWEITKTPSDPLAQKLRSALGIVVGLSAVEVAVVFVLTEIGLIRGPLLHFSGTAGAMRLFMINAGVTLGIILLGRLWKIRT